MKKNRRSKVNESAAVAVCGLFLVMLAVCFGCGFAANRNPAGKSDIVVLDSPDMQLMGGWVFKNPDNEFQLLAFEFGPDSTFIVMNFADGQQVGEKMTGKCVYLTVNGYKAIDMTIDGGETMHYYYAVADDMAVFTNSETGEVMELQLVKKVTIKE